jgi:outer membrane biosynthesis protein TonB
MTKPENAKPAKTPPAKPADAKEAKAQIAKKPNKPEAAKKAAEKTSGLDAAAKVLAETGEPMNCKDIVETALAKGYWKSDGKTPAATVYSAILREIQKKGEESRFRKTERGKFALASSK